MQTRDNEKTNRENADETMNQPPMMLGTVNLDQLIDYYEKQIILMHRLLQDRQRELERLAHKLEERSCKDASVGKG